MWSTISSLFSSAIKETFEGAVSLSTTLFNTVGNFLIGSAMAFIPNSFLDDVTALYVTTNLVDNVAPVMAQLALTFATSVAIDNSSSYLWRWVNPKHLLKLLVPSQLVIVLANQLGLNAVGNRLLPILTSLLKPSMKHLLAFLSANGLIIRSPQLVDKAFLLAAVNNMREGIRSRLSPVPKFFVNYFMPGLIQAPIDPLSVNPLERIAQFLQNESYSLGESGAKGLIYISSAAKELENTLLSPLRQNLDHVISGGAQLMTGFPQPLVALSLTAGSLALCYGAYQGIDYGTRALSRKFGLTYQFNYSAAPRTSHITALGSSAPTSAIYGDAVGPSNANSRAFLLAGNTINIHGGPTQGSDNTLEGLPMPHSRIEELDNPRIPAASHRQA